MGKQKKLTKTHTKKLSMCKIKTIILRVKKE